MIYNEQVKMHVHTQIMNDPFSVNKRREVTLPVAFENNRRGSLYAAVCVRACECFTLF